MTTRSKSEHDALHPTPENGRQYCGCVCQRCWKAWVPFVKKGQTPTVVGKCMCSYCPCERDDRRYVEQVIRERRKHGTESMETTAANAG